MTETNNQTGPDAELLRLVAVFESASAERSALNDQDLDDPNLDYEAYEARFDQNDADFWHTLKAIVETPATTLPGLRAKASASRIAVAYGVCTSPGRVVENGDPYDVLAWRFAGECLAVLDGFSLPAAQHVETQP